MVWPEPPNYYEIPSGVYKVILQQPAYPIIYPDPSFSQIVSNIRLDNWLFAGGMTLFGAAAGYYTGSRHHWQKPAMYFGTLFMGQLGLVWGLQDSAYRLMGYKENSKEVAANMPGLLAREQY